MSYDGTVAPYAGAWIETADTSEGKRSFVVAPYAGAWIETISARCPLQSRYVAPYAGAWIETYTMVANFLGAIRRALRGRVD